MFVRFVDDNELHEALRRQQEVRTHIENRESIHENPSIGTLVGDTTLMLNKEDIQHSPPQLLKRLVNQYDILTSSPELYQLMERKIRSSTTLIRNTNPYG